MGDRRGLHHRYGNLLDLIRGRYLLRFRDPVLRHLRNLLQGQLRGEFYLLECECRVDGANIGQVNQGLLHKALIMLDAFHYHP